ncbi:MAG: hypothetical protein DWB42_05830 [Chloroflexi bacterium]|nr:hypothetical protein [Chloroflexota bacterium]MDL1883091.1 hypothetical protein [Anaerolineae bacterium CFX8]
MTCPVRSRQDWLIAEDAAAFFFPPDTTWTSLTEVRLPTRTGVICAGCAKHQFHWFVPAGGVPRYNRPAVVAKPDSSETD